MYAEENFNSCWSFVRVLLVLHFMGTYSAADIDLKNNVHENWEAVLQPLLFIF